MGGPNETNLNFSCNFLEFVRETTALICQCSKEREWNRLNRPRSLVLAIVGEAGELAEIFQFQPDWDSTISKEVVDKASQEIADITIYLLQLSQQCNVDLAK